MAPWLPQQGTCTRSRSVPLAALPASKRSEKRLLRARRERLLGQATGELHGRAHLRQVNATRRAVAEVHLEPRAHRGWEPVLEIVRDQLDELLAAQVVGVDDHARAPWRFRRRSVRV